MTTSELIKSLQSCLETHGDLPVSFSVSTPDLGVFGTRPKEELFFEAGVFEDEDGEKGEIELNIRDFPY